MSIATEPERAARAIIIYFTILLVLRERRDHRMCAAKDGADWDAYCKRVRWRMFPGLY